MKIEIKTPVLPESVKDALLLEWHKSAGDAVKRDEVLVEVETDKVVLEVPAPEDGVLTEIIAEAGSVVTSGDVLAGFESTGASDAGDGAQPPAAAASKKRFGPSVRRLLEQHDINSDDIPATGADGQLTKEDVLNYIAAAVAPDDDAAAAPPPTERDRAAPAAPPRPQPMRPTAADGTRESTREPMSRLRQTIADRLLHARQTTAMLTTFNEVNMQSVIALRREHQPAFEQKHGVRLGFMSFFVKAAVAALQRFPQLNAQIDGTDIVSHHYIDISIAVAAPRGLVVPVLRNCEQMRFADIENQLVDFGQRAQDGRITVEELSGGTFTITNGGVFGSLLSTPIINPPQSAILGMHRIQERPVCENGAVVARPMMYLALSYDHRIVDGKEAVQFLGSIAAALADPARLLLDLG